MFDITDNDFNNLNIDYNYNTRMFKLELTDKKIEFPIDKISNINCTFSYDVDEYICVCINYISGTRADIAFSYPINHESSLSFAMDLFQKLKKRHNEIVGIEKLRSGVKESIELSKKKSEENYKQILVKNKEQDQIYNDCEKKINEISELSEKMKEELKKQNVMIEQNEKSDNKRSFFDYFKTSSKVNPAY